VVLHYLRGHLDEIKTITEGAIYKIRDISVEFPIRHDHPTETYGYTIKWSGGSVCHIVETGFFPALIDAYSCDLLILNIVLNDSVDEKAPYIKHLNFKNARELIGGIKPATAILTHFGMNMLRAKPWEIAAKIQADTGVEVIAASDGMTYSP
jgi:phosphoribosyl 1,2-cyclic phosphodiesterase